MLEPAYIGLGFVRFVRLRDLRRTICYTGNKRARVGFDVTVELGARKVKTGVISRNSAATSNIAGH